LYHESQASCAGLVTQQFYKEFTKSSLLPKFTQAFIICWHTPAATETKKNTLELKQKKKNSFTIITHNTLVSQKKKIH